MSLSSGLRVHASRFIASADALPVFVLLLANGLAVLWPLLPGGYLVNGDHPCRFAEAWYMADFLLLGQHNPFGWNPYLQTGLPMFTFGPTFLPILMTSLVKLALFLPQELAYNLVFVFSYLLYSVAAYLFARSLGMGTFSSFCFSFMLCFTFTPFPTYIYFSLPNAALIVGVWPYALGVALAFLANHRFISLTNGSGARSLLEYSSLAALTGLSNVLATFGLGFMSLAFVTSDLLKKRDLRRSARLLGYVTLAAALGLTLSSFYLALPFIYGDQYYKLWSEPLDPSTRSVVLVAPLVMPWFETYASRPGGWFLESMYLQSYVTTWALGLVGVGASLILWRSDGLFFIFLALASLFGAAGGLGSFVPQYLRFFDFTRIAWIGLACVAIDCAVRLISKKSKLLAPLAGAALLAVAFVPQASDSATYLWLARSRDSGGPLVDAGAAIRWLADSSDPSGAVYIEDTTFWDNPAEPMNQLWFGHAFGAAFMELGPRRVFGGFYGFWFKPYWNSWWDINWGAYAGNSQDLRALFAKYDVRYALAFTNALKEKLSDPAYFSKVFESGDFAVYEVRDFSEAFAYSLSGRPVETIELKPDLMRFRITGAQPRDALVVKMGYMPHWIASAEGSPLDCSPYDAAFMMVSLPEGDHEVTLIYQPLLMDHALRLLALLGWCVVALLCLFKPRATLPF